MDVPKLRITGDYPPFEELSKIVDILIGRGYNEISEYHLPSPDVSLVESKRLAEGVHRIDQIQNLQFSEGQAEAYIKSFLKHFDSCYKNFVEFCFPTFKDKFEFYGTMPHEYFVYKRGSDVRTGGMMGYRQSNFGKAIINFRDFISMDDAFSKGETKMMRSFQFDGLIHNDHLRLIKTIDNFNTPKIDEYCVLRNWVYRFLEDDLKIVYEENDSQ